MVRDILFVAGEVSGDLHAAGVARELKAQGAPFRLTGIGGDQMRAAGVELLEHVEQLAVMGFVEVLQHVPKHWALLRELRRRIEAILAGLARVIETLQLTDAVRRQLADAELADAELEEGFI